MTDQSAVRLRIRVEGTVQGVGFRPFVYALAARDDLAGLVGNDARGVFIEIEGVPADVARFHAALRAEAPPLAVIERVTADPIATTGRTGFRIAASAPGGSRQTQIAPDSATCDDCLRELADPADRRHRYPFINCTNCGPRFTIVRDVPYDRPATTMAGFAMCARCAGEYHDPGDRRFHAQPVCCPDCGPTLRLLDRTGNAATGDPIAAAAHLLRAGQIVAVKGLGGYHLAADACSATATATLRARKHREDKPFAVMVADPAAARRLCHLDPAEEALLTSASRPIVLLRRRSDRFADAPAVAPAVTQGNGQLGLMLPYTPLHVLLLAEFAGPMVLTSGNVSDEPIAYLDADAGDRLAPIADAFLVNDRPIHIRTDDSVVRVVRGEPLTIRRSRGYVPGPLRLPRPARQPVLGCGAELKNTFCLAAGDRAVLSHHIGDLANHATHRSYTEGIAHLRKLYDITPQVVAHDLHPEYLSTKYAMEFADVELVGVQHHHAHIASCLVDNGETGPVIGVAFDGLGYGTDGTLWGGEFLAADLAHAERLGRLAPVPMPGGAAAIRQPWRMAAAYLDAAHPGAAYSGAAYLDGLPPALAAVTRNAANWPIIVAVSRARRHSPLTSSAGRLFDAVAALVTGRDTVTYEGQAAIGLEQLADPAEPGGYPVRTAAGPPFEVLGVDLVTSVVADLAAGAPAGRIAMRFHRGLATAIADGCELARDRTGLARVALSGGVFQNVLLLGLALDELRRRDFEVLTHHRIPPNDGGISIGQVAVAAARS